MGLIVINFRQNVINLLFFESIDSTNLYINIYYNNNSFCESRSKKKKTFFNKNKSY